MTAFFYPVYGRVLESTLPFPELPEIPAAPPRWSFDLARRLPDPHAPELLGEEPIYGDVSARFLRHDQGFRIEVDDTGVFDLSPCASEIRWRPRPEPWWDFGRGHLLGRVLAAALHLEGVVALHGSAVRMGDGVVAFLAPKGSGKSTLALRLVRAGADFVTDDTLPVEIRHGRPFAWPGVPAVRLEEEVARATGLLGEAEEAGRDGKVSVRVSSTFLSEAEPQPLSAVYLLRPVRARGGVPAVTRDALPGHEALVRLMGEMKIGEMLGPGGVATGLRVAGAMSTRVPVRSLSVVRDEARIPDVLDALVEWHGLPCALEDSPPPPREPLAAEVR